MERTATFETRALAMDAGLMTTLGGAATYVGLVSLPMRSLDTSSGPSAIMSTFRPWCSASVQPP